MFEEKKEDLVAKIPGVLHATGHRKYRSIALSIGFASTVLMWGVVLLFPHHVYRAFSLLFELRTEIFKLIFLIPIALGFALAYPVLMMRNADLETEDDIEGGVMGHYAYQQRSDRSGLCSLWPECLAPETRY